MTLTTNEEEFLHRCIHDYFSWMNDVPMIDALQQAHPEACRTLSLASARPLLVSTLLNHHHHHHHSNHQQNHHQKALTLQQPPSTEKMQSFVWNDYYELLKTMIPEKRLPPDTLDPRGFLSWCVHQRWVYKHYHTPPDNNNNNKKEEISIPIQAETEIEIETEVQDDKETSQGSDDSSHLTPDRIDKLNALGFQWNVATSNDMDVSNRIVIDRQTCNRNQLDKWRDRLETYQPYLVTRRPRDSEHSPDSPSIETWSLMQEKAEVWLAAQIERYRDWDAGFVDFAKEQRDALQALHLLPDLVESEHRHLLLESNSEKENNEEMETEFDEEDGMESKSDGETEQEDSEQEDISSPALKIGTSIGESNSTPSKRQKPLEWQHRWDQLVAFKTKHGHVNVTKSLDLPLASWVCKERGRYRKLKDVYPQDRKTMLDEIGFCWEPTVAMKSKEPKDRTPNRTAAMDWNDRLAQMVDFKNKHGHVHVTNSLDPKLSSWVKKERIRYRQKKDAYSVERKKLLDELGFCWEPSLAIKNFEREPLPGTLAAEKEVVWWQRFEELKAFKERFGHIQVPCRWSENRELSNWYRHTKERYRGFLEGRNGLPKNRLKALQEIDFPPYSEAATQSPKPKKRVHDATKASVAEEKKDNGDNSTSSRSSNATDSEESTSQVMKATDNKISSDSQSIEGREKEGNERLKDDSDDSPKDTETSNKQSMDTEPMIERVTSQNNVSSPASKPNGFVQSSQKRKRARLPFQNDATLHKKIAP